MASAPALLAAPVPALLAAPDLTTCGEVLADLWRRLASGKERRAGVSMESFRFGHFTAGKHLPSLSKDGQRAHIVYVECFLMTMASIDQRKAAVEALRAWTKREWGSASIKYKRRASAGAQCTDIKSVVMEVSRTLQLALAYLSAIERKQRTDFGTMTAPSSEAAEGAEMRECISNPAAEQLFKEITRAPQPLFVPYAANAPLMLPLYAAHTARLEMDGTAVPPPFPATSLITLCTSAFDASRTYVETLVARALRTMGILAFTNGECLTTTDHVIAAGEDPDGMPQSRAQDVIVFLNQPPHITIEGFLALDTDEARTTFFGQALKPGYFVGMEVKTDFNLPHADRAFGVATRGPINQERCPLVIMCMRAENIPTGALSNVMCMAGLAGHYRVTPSGKIRVQEEEVNAIRRHGATRTATALQRVHRVIEKLEACGLRKAVLLSMGHASTPEAGQASSSTLGSVIGASAPAPTPAGAASSSTASTSTAAGKRPLMPPPNAGTDMPAPRRVSPRNKPPVVPLLGPVAAADDSVFLRAQAPPPSPSVCEAPGAAAASTSSELTVQQRERAEASRLAAIARKRSR